MPKSVHHLISEKKQEFKDSPALKFGNSVLSYAQLEEQSNQIAHSLLKLDIHKGDLIGLSVDRSAEMVIVLLGILKCGAAYVPIDPAYPADRKQYMLENSNARLLITSKQPGSKASRVKDNKVFIDDLVADSLSLSVESPYIISESTDLAYVLYTSGSTGKPKGVKITHGNLSNFLLSMQKVPGITAEDKVLAISTISFDISGLEIYLPLMAGAEVIVAPTSTAKDGRLLLEQIKNDKITLFQATPSTYRMLIDSGWNYQLPVRLLCGGEALSKDLATMLLERSIELWNVYGPTETTVWCTLRRISAAEDLITIGNPIDNTTVYILDDQMNPLPAGVKGEIYIGGAGVGLGYLNNPTLTAEKFMENPFEPGTKFYRTGDFGKKLDNGEFLCLGRTDNQVKIRGFRIELGEINTVVDGLEGVKQAVVVAVEERADNKRLVAYVVRKPGGLPTKDLLKTWRAECSSQLPAFMVPDFVILEKFQLTPNGKIDTKAFPKPQDIINEAITVADLASTDEEKLLTQIWKDKLNVKEVGIHDDFFSVGGNSLIAIQLISAISKQTGFNIPMTALFEVPTIYSLAKLIEPADKQKSRGVQDDEVTKAPDYKSLVPIRTEGSKIPMYIIHGAGSYVMKLKGLAKYVDKDQPVYGLQAIGLNGSHEMVTRLEEIAAIYISDILKQNPTGPYALTGYSFGGTIAFEMARQLKAMNKKVTMVAMLDTYAYHPDFFKSPLTKLYNKVTYSILDLLYKFSMLFRNPKYVCYFITHYKLHGYLDKFRIFKDKAKDDALQTERDFLNKLDKVQEAYETAFHHYKLTPQDIQIDMFLSEDRIFYVKDPKYFGWKSLALKGINKYIIPGDHFNLLDEPNNVKIAEILQALLDERNGYGQSKKVESAASSSLLK